MKTQYADRRTPPAEQSENRPKKLRAGRSSFTRQHCSSPFMAGQYQRRFKSIHSTSAFGSSANGLQCPMLGRKAAVPSLSTSALLTYDHEHYHPALVTL